jgi:integrase
VPFPQTLAVELSAHNAATVRHGDWLLADQWGQQLTPWTLERAWTKAKRQVPGVPPELRRHDLRHYLASRLIASSADVKVAVFLTRAAKQSPEAQADA